MTFAADGVCDCCDGRCGGLCCACVFQFLIATDDVACDAGDDASPPVSATSGRGMPATPPPLPFPLLPSLFNGSPPCCLPPNHLCLPPTLLSSSNARAIESISCPNTCAVSTHARLAAIADRISVVARGLQVDHHGPSARRQFKIVTFAQIQPAAAAVAREAIADAEARAAVLNERLRLLTEEREMLVSRMIIVSFRCILAHHALRRSRKNGSCCSKKNPATPQSKLMQVEQSLTLCHPLQTLLRLRRRNLRRPRLLLHFFRAKTAPLKVLPAQRSSKPRVHP